MTKNERIAWFYRNMENYGIGYEDANKLHRIEMTLSRWCEAECGNSDNYKSWSIERDEKTDIPYMCIYPHKGDMRRYVIADRERGALKRLKSIMQKYPKLRYYYQTDPRGCSLYVIRKKDLKGLPINQVYNRGLCCNY